MTTDLNLRRLAKALARAASASDSEAVTALKSVRRMLEQAGVDFVDLAHALETHDEVAGEVQDLRETVFDLRRQLRRERSEKRRLQTAAPAPVQPGPVPTAPDDARTGTAALAEAHHQIEQLGRHLTAALAERGTLLRRLEDLTHEVERLRATQDAAPFAATRPAKAKPSQRHQQFLLF